MVSGLEIYELEKKEVGRLNDPPIQLDVTRSTYTATTMIGCVGVVFLF